MMTTMVSDRDEAKWEPIHPTQTRMGDGVNDGGQVDQTVIPLVQDSDEDGLDDALGN
jgi:hypothetical protein